MPRPYFTDEQEQWLCALIDFWYVKWHKKLVPPDNTHQLGIATEQLKELLVKYYPQEALKRLIES
jgi:hypothetical protein